MSIRIRPYGKVWDITTLQSPDISLPDLAVYGYLCYRAGSSGSCYPTQNRIATDLHLSCDSLTRITKHLLRAGAISLKKMRVPGRQGYSHHYTINPPPSSQTYGIVTERMINVCRDLSCGAIGLWFYLTAAAGTGVDIYITRSDLANRLNISIPTLRKYIKELTNAGELSSYNELINGGYITRFVMLPFERYAGEKSAVITLRSPKIIDSSCLTAQPDKAPEIKINREEYLSVDKCATSAEAFSKQKAIYQELAEIYHCDDDLQTTISYDDVALQLKRFVRSGSRAEIMRAIKLDMRYLLAFVRRFPRAWIADPMIRSAALEVVFGSSKTENEKTVLQQLYWILATTGDERIRLLTHLDGILNGSTAARAWLAALVGRVDAALSTRPVRYPAAYVRRLILNWLTDRYAQTSDRITQLVAGDSADQPALIPQTYDELVASTFADRYRPQIRKLSRREYRIRADAYEAIVYEREAAGCPISRYDIATDNEIQDLYALMPESFFDTLRMIDPADAEAIYLLPKAELDRRAFAYRLLSTSDRRSIFWDEDNDWLLSPVMIAEEAI